MDKTIVTRNDFYRGSYITSEYYEHLLKNGFGTTQNNVEYHLHNSEGKIVHTHVRCKDGYKLFIQSIPDNLIPELTTA